MRVLITGSKGFVGRNLIVRLSEHRGFDVIEFSRDNTPSELEGLVSSADAVVHLAGENRPADDAAFEAVNAGLTRTLCGAMLASGRRLPILFASSIQAE